MDDLKKMFEIRDKTFERQTIEIFELIDTSLVCITRFLKEVDALFAAGDITWEDANLIDGSIVIIGMVDYTIGTTLDIDDNTILITADNIEYFRRIIHMSLPFDIVTEADEEVIMEFLYTMHSDNNVETFSEPLYIEDNNNPDFDLTKLTEKQKQSLMFYSNKEKN